MYSFYRSYRYIVIIVEMAEAKRIISIQFAQNLNYLVYILPNSSTWTFAAPEMASRL